MGALPRDGIATWLFRLAVVAAIGTAVGFGLLWENRRSDESYDAACPEVRAELDDSRVEFEASCSFWPRQVEILTDTALTSVSSELATEPDVFVFGGGGPTCRQVDPMRTVCDGEVDADETFSGDFEPASDPCRVKTTLRVLGEGCSTSFAKECEALDLVADVALPRPSGCGG